MSGTGGGGLNVAGQQMQQYLMRLEQNFIAGATDLREEIANRRRAGPENGGWRSPEQAREVIEGMDDDAKRVQFEWAAEQLVEDLATIPTIYHSLVRPEIEAPPLRPAVRDLLLSLHNPMVRESLLIPVAEPYEDDVRAWLAELAAVCWGFVEVTAGTAGPHHRAYLPHLAETWNIDDVDQLAQVLGLD